MSIVENGMIFEQDVPVPVSDGNVLRANVFRPDAAGACPVIMAQGVYGKDVHFEDGFKPQWDQLVSVYPELFSNGSTGRYSALGDGGSRTLGSGRVCYHPN